MSTRTFNSAKYGTITVTQERKDNDIVFTTSIAVTRDETAIIQQYMGYHPNGYSFECKPKTNITTWTCWSSCD